LLLCDELVFDARRLSIPNDAASIELDVLARASSFTIPGASLVLCRWAVDHRRRQLEAAQLSLSRLSRKSLMPVSSATAADLYHRARALARSRGKNYIKSCKNGFSFKDLQRVYLPRPVFDFVWRLLHGRLAFQPWMRIAAGGTSATCCLAACATITSRSIVICLMAWR